MIVIDFSKQKAFEANPEAIQKINFPLNLAGEGNSDTMFFSLLKEQKKLF